jgi:glutamyl-tRNA reductase
MNLLSIGISHHTASVDIREKMWFSTDEIREAVRRLKESFFSECVLVSTCNRTELYGMTRGEVPDDATVRKFLIDFKNASSLVREEHFVGAAAGEAISHLFQVAAGIDSLVIGDIQILNQVKEAFTLSREADALGPVMNRLMQSALHVGKRTRTETTICEGAVSVSYAAVELASKIFQDLSRKTALLIGAGETGELTLKHLVSKGIGHVKIANRTREKAEALVAEFGGAVVDYEQIVEALRSADIVITSVNAPTYIVQPEDVQKVMKQRSNNPLFIIDIGVPRNVNPSSKKIENVFLYDIDALSMVVDRNLEKRKAEIPRVQGIISQELTDFMQWYQSLQVGPTIADFREALEAIRREEVEKNINRFRPEDRELVELVTKRILNKILHHPTTALKQGVQNGASASDGLLRSSVLRELFGIRGNGKEHHEE